MNESKKPWGILEGIRPVKLATKLLNDKKSAQEAVCSFMLEYGATREKAELAKFALQPLIEELLPSMDHLDMAIQEEVLYRIRYKGYLERENKQIEKTKWLDAIKIAADFDYSQVHSLRNESRQKLEAIRPLTLGQASRISGVNPADIQILMVALKKNG